MKFLVKLVDFRNNVFYATPEEREGVWCLGSRDKAERFKLKKSALDTITKMKQVQGMRDYVYHIQQVNDSV